MLSLLIGAALASPAPAGGWFYPGPGPERAVFDAAGRLGGVPVLRTGRVLVSASDLASLQALPEVAALEILPGRGRVALLTLRPGADDLAFSRQLRGRPGVAWAHPDLSLPLRPQALPDDPYLPGQWHLENDGSTGWTSDVDLDAADAWGLATGAGGLIAVLDSGVDLDHPDLAVIPGRDYVGDDDDPSPEPGDESGPHGTSAAGLAAAIGGNALGVAGVAYDSEVYAIRLIGGYADLSEIYSAFVEAVDAGAWVLSNSWGFDNGCAAYPLYATLQEAIDYAEQSGRGGLGAAVVFSAGNGACDNSGDGMLVYEPVIGVAASSGLDEREWYSSFGGGVDVTAPSGNMLTTDISGDEGYPAYQGDGDYTDTFSGTSASAPVVSGLLALMFEVNPRLTAAQARQVLCETALPIDVDNALEGGAYDESGWSPYYGCGRVNAAAAVLAVADTPPEAPLLLWPGAEASEERVLLRWSAADADGDRLRYRVRWWTDGSEEPPEDSEEIEVEGDTLALTGQVDVGESVRWQVEASDAWGAGPPSAVGEFAVVEATEEPAEEKPAPEGCQSAPAGGLLAALLALLGLGGRRRGDAGF